MNQNELSKLANVSKKLMDLFVASGVLINDLAIVEMMYEESKLHLAKAERGELITIVGNIKRKITPLEASTGHARIKAAVDFLHAVKKSDEKLISNEVNKDKKIEALKAVDQMLGL